MAYTVDTSTARVTSIQLDYGEDGSITLTEVAGEVLRTDGTHADSGRMHAGVAIPDGPLKASLQTLAAQALVRLRTSRRWS